jgi:nucleotide-binding universal stress UspA family protein
MSLPGRIIVGVDAQGAAENAINVGIDLATHFDAAIELVHAVHAPHPGWPEIGASDLEAARKAVRVKLEASVSGARWPYISEDHHLVVQAGHPAEVILDRAGIEGTGLIVLGGHRSHGMFNLGNTVKGVMAHAGCPVWVQTGPVKSAIRRILVPMDLSDESLQALTAARAWAASFGASLTALHCFVSPELYYGHGYPVPGPTYVVDKLRDDARVEFETLMAGLDWNGLDHQAVFVEANPATQILEMQDEFDLVVMGTHGRTGLSSMILGNVTYTVIREGTVPVVALRHPERSWKL